MANGRVNWPTVGQKGENQEEHILHLKTEAQQLIATLKAPTPEKKNTKRGLPHDHAVRFLKSWLEWAQKEEGRTYGDPILEAIQRLEQLIVTRPPEGSTRSQNGEHGGSEGRSWAQVASADVAEGRATTGFNKGTASMKTGSPSTAHGDPCEIRIRMNNPATSTEIRQKPNTSEYILRTVNHQISQSENINKSPQTTATRKWIRAAKMLESGDIFLYAWDGNTAKTLVLWKADWIGCLGENARV
jgi:hypothetical protein